MNTNNVVIEYSVTDAAITELRNKFAGLVVPAGDNKAYKTLTSAIAEVRTLRTDVEATRKNLKEDALKYGRMVDAEAKRITDLLVAIEQPLKEQKAAFDEAAERVRRERHEAEQARIAAINARIEDIRSIGMGCGMLTADELSARIASAQLFVISNDQFAEFIDAAGNVKDKVIADLRKALDARIAADEAEAARIAEQARIDAERKAEAERLAAEQARLAAERAEFDRQQAEARRQQEAAERARIAAEQAEARAKAEAEAAKLREQDAERRRVEAEARAEREAKEAAERAERDRVAAIEAERQRAERQRIAEQEAAAREQAAREADKENRRRVNRAALEGIMAAGISEEQGKALIALIAAGKVPNIHITY